MVQVYFPLPGNGKDYEKEFLQVKCIILTNCYWSIHSFWTLKADLNLATIEAEDLNIALQALKVRKVGQF